MTSLEKTLEPMFQQVPLQEDEFWDEVSKLTCCKKCLTPRQKRLEVCGKIYIPRCMCACQSAEYDKREQERKQREFLDQVARNRSVGLTDPSLRKHTFANDLGYNPRQMAMAKQYVAHWEEFRRKSMGLLLWGDVGTGKSYIAGCIANALLDQGVPVMMTNFVRVLNKLTDLRFDNRNAYIDSFNAFPLLIIDDLGVERTSEFAQEQIYAFVDSRYRSQLPMIVTTNLTMDKMQDQSDLMKARIYGRVLERCTPVQVNNLDIRSLHNAENIDGAQRLLQGGNRR